MPIYLILILATPLFPILLSFDKNVHYISFWKQAVLSSLIVGVPFVIWDILFTKMGVWGFNEQYLVGVELFNLPLEEVAFFVVVPFACLFIYQCVKHYFRNINLKNFNIGFYILLAWYLILLGINGFWGWYTTIVFFTTLLTFPIVLFKMDRYKFVPLAFIFSLIPFLLVNGILTGSFIPEQVVWYNDVHNSQWRLFTIPLEDVVYAWSLIVFNIISFEVLLKFKKEKYLP